MKQIKFFTLFLTLFCAFAQTTVCAQSAPDAGKIATSYFANLDAGNFAALDGLLTDDFTATSSPFSPTPFDKKGWSGVGQAFKAGFPDMKHQIKEWFSDGKKVWVKILWNGTNTGSLMGNPPSGNKVKDLLITAVFELDGKGKIKSYQSFYDGRSFESQLMAGIDPNAVSEANIRKAYAALESHDYNTFAGLCADNFAELGLAPMPIKGAWNAIEQYKNFLTAFPDLKFKIGSIAPAGNNRYYLDVTLTGTNTAPFMGMPATGKSIMVHDMDIVELNAAGKCVSHWTANSAGALIQIGYGSLTNPSTAAVMDVYGKFGKGDVPGILASSTEDVMFDIQDRMFDSKGRQFKGKAAVGQFFQELGGKFQYTKFQPTRFVSDGDDVFVLIDAEYKLVSTGKTYTSTYTHHFKVVNGKIAYFRGVDDFQMTK